MELPMGNVLGLLRVDAENPQVRVETINLPVGMYLEDFPRTMRGRTVPQPIRVRFRDGINVSEIEYNRSKKDICIQTLDSAGGVIERWDLRGCFPTEVSYHPIGENEEQLYLELTLHYDCCSLHL
jgi:hypothetical protein